MEVNNLIAAGALCCSIFAAGYGAIIAPLQSDIEKQGVQLAVVAETNTRARTNTESLDKQDIRIEQNSKRIQLGEINAAKREVQMEHLTAAIRELNIILKEMKEK